MFSYLLEASGVFWLAGAGIVVGISLLVDLARSAFTTDYDYVQVDRGEIVEVDQ